MRPLPELDDDFSIMIDSFREHLLSITFTQQKGGEPFYCVLRGGVGKNLIRSNRNMPPPFGAQHSFIERIRHFPTEILVYYSVTLFTKQLPTPLAEREIIANASLCYMFVLLDLSLCS